MDIKEILKEREARGLIISVYGHFAAFAVFFLLAVNLPNNESVIYFWIVMTVSILFGLLRVKKRSGNDMLMR